MTKTLHPDQANTPMFPLFGEKPMSQTILAFPLTSYAKTRRQQRSISRRAVVLVCRYGRSFPERGGCRRNVLTACDAAWLMSEGEPMQVIDEAKRLVVITSAEGAVVTCYVESRRPALRAPRRYRFDKRRVRRR